MQFLQNGWILAKSARSQRLAGAFVGATFWG